MTDGLSDNLNEWNQSYLQWKESGPLTDTEVAVICMEDEAFESQL